MTVERRPDLTINCFPVPFFQILAYADIVFTTVFTIEIVLKVDSIARNVLYTSFKDSFIFVS